MPLLVRWTGVIKPDTIYTDIISQEDWMQTLLAAAGEPDIVEKLKNGYEANGKTFKVHPDGYNFLPYFKGEAKASPRHEIYYFSQGGELNAILLLPLRRRRSRGGAINVNDARPWEPRREFQRPRW